MGRTITRWTFRSVHLRLSLRSLFVPLLVLQLSNCDRNTNTNSRSTPVADQRKDTFETVAAAVSPGIADTLPRSLRQNEPPGFIPFAISSGSRVPHHRPGENREMSRTGNHDVDDDDDDDPADKSDMGWWYSQPPGNPRLKVIEDPTAPVSPPRVMRIKFPQGWRAGSGPVTWGGWDAAGKGRRGQKEQVYFSMWIKIEGTEFENQAVGTKMGFFGAATPISYAPHNTWFFLKGPGRQITANAFPVEVHQSLEGPGAPGDRVRNIAQNVTRGRVMTVGVWHHWEALLSLNTPGQPNGIFKWWIDGDLVMNYANMTYIYGSFTNGFYDFNFNPTWGGMGGVKTKEDAILIDHIYMSGLPMTSQTPEPIDTRRRGAP